MQRARREIHGAFARMSMTMGRCDSLRRCRAAERDHAGDPGPSLLHTEVWPELVIAGASIHSTHLLSDRPCHLQKGRFYLRTWPK